MEPHGFIRDMLDVKVLILAVVSRLQYPVTGEQIYELAYQDETLSYFDVQEAVPQMVTTGHLQLERGNRYSITEKGRDVAGLTDSSVAYPVLQRVIQAVNHFNAEEKRKGYIQTKVKSTEKNEFFAELILNDAEGQLVKMELMAPSERQAIRLCKALEKCAEPLYQTIMDALSEEME